MAIPIQPGNTIVITTNVEFEIRMFRIDLESAGTLTVQTSGNVDTFGLLVESFLDVDTLQVSPAQDNLPLIANEDSGQDQNFRLQSELAAGSYFIQVLSFGQGMYELFSTFDQTPVVDDHGDVLSEATPIELAKTVAAASGPNAVDTRRRAARRSRRGGLARLVVVSGMESASVARQEPVQGTRSASTAAGPGSMHPPEIEGRSCDVEVLPVAGRRMSLRQPQ